MVFARIFIFYSGSSLHFLIAQEENAKKSMLCANHSSNPVLCQNDKLYKKACQPRA